jgi:hypothetical protein
MENKYSTIWISQHRSAHFQIRLIDEIKILIFLSHYDGKGELYHL